MTFLSPWGLLGLIGLPVLVWLWRWSASRHRTVVSSLIPFEHLLRRSPTRRVRPLVNVLFWLQAAAIALAAASLARPALTQARPKTVLVILDTSASTAAALGGASAFHRAREALQHRLARPSWREQFLIVTTAPLGPLTPAPTGDTRALQDAVSRLKPAALGGHLAMAARLGRALLGDAPDETLVLTDEPAVEGLQPGATLRSFGAPLPNVAIIGVETQTSLCTVGEPNVTVTVQNFSDSEQLVTVDVRRRGRVLASAQARLAPDARASVPLRLPEAAAEPLEVRVDAPRDALAMDDRAWVRLPASSTLPITLVASRADAAQALGRWLDACPRLAWERVAPDDPALAGRLAEASRRDPAAILVTDQAGWLESWTGPAIVFGAPVASGRVRAASWLVDQAHPLGEYLQLLETVAAAPPSPTAPGLGGEPVIWSVADGRRAPLVQAALRQGRRVAALQFDPLSTASDVQPAIVFLNSLRWLSGSLGFVMTGESLHLGPLAAGLVLVQRPDGDSSRVPHAGGAFSYDEADAPGRYRFETPAGAVEQLVNFMNPIESNLRHRVSTWVDGPEADGAPSRARRPDGRVPPRTQPEPLAGYTVLLLLAVWFAEWLLYARRGSRG